MHKNLMLHIPDYCASPQLGVAKNSNKSRNESKNQVCCGLRATMQTLQTQASKHKENKIKWPTFRVELTHPHEFTFMQCFNKKNDQRTKRF